MILQLDRAVTTIAPARVAQSTTDSHLYASGTSVLAIGWGTIDHGEDIVSAELRLAPMQVADPTATLNSGAIRVGETGSGRPQSGDSGGPLIAYDQFGAIVIGVYTGSGTYDGNQHFYMKTTIDPLFP